MVTSKAAIRGHLPSSPGEFRPEALGVVARIGLKSASLGQMCAVKVGAFQQEFVLPGNWFVPPGNNRSSSRGNEAVGAFGVKGRLSDSVSM